MASIGKPKGSSKWVIWYRDEWGRRRKKVGTRDRAVTQRIANELENRAALARAGLVDPRDEARRDHEAVPIARHLADYAADLAARGRTPGYVRKLAFRASAVLSRAGTTRISGLSAASVVLALAAIRAEKGLAQETINHHVRAVKGFSRWLWREGRAADHRLAHLSTASSDADRRRRRRALSADEAARLIAAARAGGPRHGLSGPDRAMLYAIAMGTGLRASECLSLTPEGFDPARRTLTVPARYTKNGEEAVQPVARALAGELAAWLAGRPPGVPAFAGASRRTAEMLAADLAAAGVEASGPAGVVDFHALRATYITNLVASGASVKVCQSLARHSTPSLTIGLYAKVAAHDLDAAVESLPDCTAGAPRPPKANRKA